MRKSSLPSSPPLSRMMAVMAIMSIVGVAGATTLAPSTAQAQPVRPNVLIVFDTSSSMLTSRAMCGGVPGQCDGSPLCSGQGQGSRLFRLKQAIRETLTEVGGDEANFGLGRFPQRTTPEMDRGCYRGHYTNAVENAPGEGCRTTAPSEDAGGAFFSPTIAEEVIVVPVTTVLPPTSAADYDPPGANIPILHKWLNNVEISDGTRMTEPEIRSGGGHTPLAATLTYVRHYFNKYVKPVDPKAGCRKDIVILATDGAETCMGDAPAASRALFDNPSASGGRVSVYVVAEASASAGERNNLNAIARGGSGGMRDAIFVDFTNPTATKQAFIQIIAESVPPAETCNGVDDNCNGDVDNMAGKDGPLPGVGAPCLCGGLTEAQAGKGICKRGMTVCKGASGLACEGCVGPQKEICNGIDDDCNGLVDDGVDGVGRPCACEGGVPLMTLMTGECKPGRAVCKGKEPLDCEGCQAPKPELCDCKDNNCNGMSDEGKTCEAGFVCLRNMAKGVCECQPECGSGEFPCPPGLYCDTAEKPPVCKSARCANKVCPEGFTCDEGDGQCKDVCANVKCAEPKVCKAGRCVDCYTEGCPAGLICRDGRCEKNPCEGKKCGPQGGVERFCNEKGQCEALCFPQCAPGLECVKGKCERNNCSDKTCPSTDVCDPRTGKCQPDQCLLKVCGGQACVPLTGECKDNPCAAVKCPDCYACQVTPDGAGSCQLVQACYPEDVIVTNTGRGCACGLGGADAMARPLAPLLGVGLGVALLRRRRRR